MQVASTIIDSTVCVVDSTHVRVRSMSGQCLASEAYRQTSPIHSLIFTLVIISILRFNLFVLVALVKIHIYDIEGWWLWFLFNTFSTVGNSDGGKCSSHGSIYQIVSITWMFFSRRPFKNSISRCPDLPDFWLL